MHITSIRTSLKSRRTLTGAIEQAVKQGAGFGLEAIEPRVLLASDLGVQFDSANLNLPAHLVPGQHVLAPILVIDNGPNDATGAVDIQYYLSTDTVLDTSQDRLLRAYSAQPLALSGTNGDPNQIGDFTGDLTIPADMAPGTYHLLARIIPNSAIGDFNSSDDIAVAAGTTNVVRQFGTIDGQSGITLTLLDGEGTTVNFSMTGTGVGTVTPTNGGFSIVIQNAGNNSAALVTVSGGDGAFDLTGLDLQSPLGSFTATAARLTGPLNISNSLSALTIANVLGPLSITVPSTSAKPTFVFGGVSDLSITSSVGINSITARRWNNTDGIADVISAPWLGSMTITNGAMRADLRLSGRDTNADGAGPTLGNVTVSAGIRGGTWAVNGVGSDINAAFTGFFWSASFARYIHDVNVAGVLRGIITAKSIHAVNVGVDLLDASILAGTYYGTDGVVGGTGSDADVFTPGNIGQVSVHGSVFESTIAAGLAPLSGGKEQLAGGLASAIGPITVGGSVPAGSRFLANQYGAIKFGGSTINWHGDSRFAIDTLPPSFIVTDTTQGSNFATITLKIISSSVVDTSTITSMAMQVIGPDTNPFPVTALFTGVVAGTRRAAVFATFTIHSAGASWSVGEMGMYQFSVVGGVLADTRGNTSSAGLSFIATVTI